MIQTSSRFVRDDLGRDRIVVVAAMEKLVALEGRRLLVDTGDASLDRELAGFIPVRTGARRTAREAKRCTRAAASSAELAMKRKTSRPL